MMSCFRDTNSTDEDAGSSLYGCMTTVIQQRNILGLSGRGITTTWSSSAHGPH
jgi:hypothetical protein